LGGGKGTQRPSKWSQMRVRNLFCRREETRNLAKLPVDFVFALITDECAASRSQFATLNAIAEGATNEGTGRGQHRKYLPYAFTEHGAIMAATLLSSPRAVEVSVYVVRAFVRLRELAVTHSDLAERLSELEEKTEGLAMQQDTFSRNTRAQLKQVFDALRELMTPPQPPDPPKRSIGFVLPEDSGKKGAASGRRKR
jgi:ORF6N domain